jgi:hypothetical protein
MITIIYINICEQLFLYCIYSGNLQLRGCLVPGVKNFGVSHRMFHGMSKGVFG